MRFHSRIVLGFMATLSTPIGGATRVFGVSGWGGGQSNTFRVDLLEMHECGRCLSLDGIDLSLRGWGTVELTSTGSGTLEYGSIGVLGKLG